MVMDGHTRLLGALHIVFGVLTLVAMGLVALFFGVIFAFAEIGSAELGMLASLGAIVAVPAALLCIAEIVSAVFLMRGSAAAKTWLIVIGAIGLINVPLGTLLGIYTFWVLLRQVPAASTGGMAGSGAG